mmetsp:Transcript_3832/g.7667  ORF Transcript_3832/g.7667 Transcript_3832/m.7667 type:complete len:195 (+) Transcript_3832:116-700(+)
MRAKAPNFSSMRECLHRFIMHMFVIVDILENTYPTDRGPPALSWQFVPTRNKQELNSFPQNFTCQNAASARINIREVAGHLETRSNSVNHICTRIVHIVHQETNLQNQTWCQGFPPSYFVSPQTSKNPTHDEKGASQVACEWDQNLCCFGSVMVTAESLIEFRIQAQEQNAQGSAHKKDGGSMTRADQDSFAKS